MSEEKRAVSYDASQFMSGGIEAWRDGPNIPALWLHLKPQQFGDWYEGWPQVVERVTPAGGVEAFPLDEMTVGSCLRCEQAVYLPKRFWDGRSEHDEFCQLCWLKMQTNVTVRGMRAMLIDLGADPAKVDEMWMLNGSQ